MNKRYNEQELQLVLNFDTNKQQRLTLLERIHIHRLIVQVISLKPYKIDEALSAKIASILIEIEHCNYKIKRKRYSFDDSTAQLILK